MKKFLLISLVLVFTCIQGTAAQDSASKSLLTYYYQVKDALVAGNSSNASSGAGQFVKAANATDYKLISEGNISALVKDASKIAASSDITKQRQYFENFSANMIAVAKALKLSENPVYQVYCPMKKASWLSQEKAIKNPYYGSSMLTCGEVTDTIR